MIVWRIIDSRHVDSAFSGIGTEKYGGRFNSKGRKVAYAAGSISLAMLEMLVQANKRNRLTNHVCISATFDDSMVEAVEAKELPAEWAARPYTHASQNFGDQWLDEERSLVLRVPSIVNPYERNLLINPLHPRFDEIEIGDSLPAPFDPRLFELA